MEMNKSLAVYLRQYREKADLTQGELAEKLDISRQSVIALESGKCVPSVALALKIAHFFELPVEFIFRYFDEGLETLFGQLTNEVSEEIDENKENLSNHGGSMPRGLVPWSPWREMMNMREDIDRFFEEPVQAHSATFYPSVSVRETGEEFVIEADIPGVKDEDLDVEIEENRIILKGERKFKQESKGEDYYHLESSYGSFSRTISLPSYVDAEGASAEIKEGMLEIRVPKIKQREPKKIPVQRTQAKSSSKKVKR
jgi:HSP20 family protein